MTDMTIWRSRLIANGGWGDSPIKVSTDVRARALAFSGVNFCPGIGFWEVKSMGSKFLQDIYLEYFVIFGARNFVRPQFCTRRTSVPTFIRESVPPPLPPSYERVLQSTI